MSVCEGVCADVSVCEGVCACAFGCVHVYVCDLLEAQGTLGDELLKQSPRRFVDLLIVSLHSPTNTTEKG